MFDVVAKNYDRTNSILSAGTDVLWRIATVKAVAPKAGERILDLAAGTGTSSQAFVKSGAEIVAADFSAGMIEVGRVKHPNITFVLADAMDLPFADNEFDAVTISFGLRNIHDPQKGLDEMFRVLKPGGRLVICEFSTPPRALFRVGYSAYLRYVMPTVIGATTGDAKAYGYLAESIREWPDQTTLSTWIRGAGFTRVAYRNLTVGVVALHRGHKPLKAARARKAVAAQTIAPTPTPTPTPNPTGAKAPTL